MLKKIYLTSFLFLLLISSYFYFRNIIDFNWIKLSYFDKTMIVISTILLTYIANKIIDVILRNSLLKLLKNNNHSKKVFPILSNVLSILVWILWILIWLWFLWYNPMTLLTWAWIWWVFIAIVWKEAIMNFFWSIALIFNKNFKIGDNIAIMIKKNYEWIVDEITLTHTKIIDKSWNIVFIPNKNILVETIENLSQKKFKKVELKLNILPETKIEEIKTIIWKLEKRFDKNKEIEDSEIFLDIENQLVLNIALKTHSKMDLCKFKTSIISEIQEEFQNQNLGFWNKL